MNNITLITDTSSDLPASIVEQFNITQIPFYVSFDQVKYEKEIVELSLADFYKRMRAEKAFPKTSLPSINDYYEVFEPLAKQQKEIICVCLSSHFSGSYNSAVNARELILENYPDTKIEIINSLNATAGQGLLVCEIARMIQDNISFDRILEIIPQLIQKSRIFFFVDTLDYLENGGRIGKASALLGTMLNVKPLLYLEEGLLYPAAKVRGKKKAFAKVFELVKDYVKTNPENYRFAIAHADNLDYANDMNQGLIDQVGATIETPYSLIGTTIGVNTGPDVSGICIIPKYTTLINN
ncbi:MAG: DegV family protein [Cellulosilyticaceae bacterium]